MSGHAREPRDNGSDASRIHRVAASNGALVLAGGWAFAEASLWFIVPDVFAAFVVLYATRRFGPALGAVVLGGLLGGLALMLLTSASGGIGDLLVALPGITASDLGRASSELQAQGAVALLNGPLQGLPVKVYVHEATLLGMPIPLVAAFIVLNRLERVGISLLAAALAGWALRRWIARRPRLTLLLYVAGWVAIYVTYYTGRPI